MALLLIRLFADGRVQWLDASGAVREGWPTHAANRHPCVVLVPGEQVLLLDMPRVARRDAQLAQALPYAVEDQLAGAIELQHVAWAPASDASHLRVAVVARERMTAWLAALDGAGLSADVLLPEPLALAPPDPGRIRLLFEDQRVTLRLSESCGQVANLSEFSALRQVLGFDPAQCDACAVAGASPDWPGAALERADSALSAFSASAAAPELNLLQGDYAPRHRRRAAGRAWQLAASLAGAALLFALAQAAVDGRKLAGLAAAQRLELQGIRALLAPGTADSADPAAALQARLATPATRPDPALHLLSRAAPVLAADSRLRLDGLEYRDRRLDLVVQAKDVASLDQLRQRLTEAGLAADISASTAQAQGVQGRLRVGLPP